MGQCLRIHPLCHIFSPSIQRELNHVWNLKLTPKHFRSTGIIGVQMDNIKDFSQLFQYRQKPKIQEATLIKILKAMKLQRDDPKPRKCSVGGCQDDKILPALNIHLHDEILGTILMADRHPMIQGLRRRIRMSRKPFPGKGDERAAGIQLANGSVTKESWYSVLFRKFFFKLETVFYPRREASLHILEVIRDKIGPILTASNANEWFRASFWSQQR